MSISASVVKELRDRTGCGMMECKKALTDTGGDIEAAIELMRKSGQAKAAKKAGRIAAEGTILIKHNVAGTQAAMVEINCETDFVAKDANFQAFASAVTERVLSCDVQTVEELLLLPLGETDPQTVNEAREALIAKIGENINVRRFIRYHTKQGHLASYRHGNRIGVMVELRGGNEVLGKDIAMHIAASNPICVAADDVPADLLAKEREIYRAQVLDSGKPADIVEKIVDGRMRKYLGEVTLLGQPFVKDPEITVGKLLDQAKAEAIRFQRFEVGEGIEKKAVDFAEEVMAQVRG